MFIRYTAISILFVAIFLFPARSSAEMATKYQMTVIGGNSGSIVASDFDADGGSMSSPVPVAGLRYAGSFILDAITVQKTSAAPGQSPIGVKVAFLVRSLSSPSHDYIAILQRTQSGYEQVPGKLYKIPNDLAVNGGFYALSDKSFLVCLYERSHLPNRDCMFHYITENAPGAHDSSQDAIAIRAHYGMNAVSRDWVISEFMPASISYRPGVGTSYSREGYILVSQENRGEWPSYVYFFSEGGTTRQHTAGVPDRDIYLMSGAAASATQPPVATRVLNTDWSGHVDFQSQQFAGETVIGPAFTGSPYSTMLCSLYGVSGWRDMGLHCVDVNSLRVPENSLTNAARFVTRQYVPLSNAVGDFLSTLTAEQKLDFFITNSVQIITSAPQCNIDGGGMSITDALALSKYSLGLFRATQQGEADIFRYCDAPPTCNGRIDIIDVLYVARIAAGITQPGGECQ